MWKEVKLKDCELNHWQSIHYSLSLLELSVRLLICRKFPMEGGRAWILFSDRSTVLRLEVSLCSSSGNWNKTDTRTCHQLTSTTRKIHFNTFFCPTFYFRTESRMKQRISRLPGSTPVPLLPHLQLSLLHVSSFRCDSCSVRFLRGSCSVSVCVCKTWSLLH